MQSSDHAKSAALELAILLDKFDWFYDVSTDANVICVYVKYMNKDVMNIVPDEFHGLQVKLAFNVYMDWDNKYTSVLDLAREE